MSSSTNYSPSPFVEELERILLRRRISWRKLAELTNYHPSWLSKVRHGAPPSADLVRCCDEALDADGTLIALAAVRKTRNPAQLPPPPGAFVGRRSELGRIREVLTRQGPSRTPTVVVIEGPPGVGKTTTALRCAHDIVRSHPSQFPDGQLYVNLHGYSSNGHSTPSASVLEEFLVALGVPPDEIPGGGEQCANLYRSLLARRRLLIVLDNAASSQQVEPLLPGASSCAVVVTSRRRLMGLAMRVATDRVPLSPMPEGESMEVLSTAIGKVRSDFSTGSLATLARWCGHLPLALRIAAERIAAHHHHPVSELVDELATEKRRLDALTMDDSLAVRTVFGWSYRDLAADEALMFQKLSLHRGPHISVEGAAALAGTSAAKAQSMLQKLATVHLLEAAPHSRYHFHDLLRVYAAESLEAQSTQPERSASVRRLADWYLHSTVAGSQALSPFRLSPLELGPPPIEVAALTFASDQLALQWFDIEAPNFPAIIKLAVDSQLYETAWKLAVALFDYLRLLRKPGSLWLATSTLAEKAARAAGDGRAQGWVTTSLAEAYRWLRQYDRSQQLFQHSLALQRAAGDHHGRAWATAGLGFLAIDRGRLKDAHGYAQDALALFDEAGDRNGQASALLTLADAYHGWRRHDDTLEALLHSLEIFKDIRNHDGQGLTLAKIAETHAALGEHEQALDYLDQSLQARRMAGSRWGEADALARRGRTLQTLGRSEEARVSLEAASTLYEEIDDPRAEDIRVYLQGRTTDPGPRLLSRPAW